MSTATNSTTVSESGARITLNVNGRSVQITERDGESLLGVLRDQLGLISPKNGCEPQATCGCCTVLIDGQPRLSCAMKPKQAEGKSILTAEGLSDKERDEIATCFVRAGGVQCGFCIPGFVMRSVALLNENPDPSRDDIEHALRGNLCRCTGYKKIVDAVRLLADVRQGKAVPAPDCSGRVGTRLDRYRGGEFVLGDFQYVDDMKIDGGLFAAMRFSDHPRATLKGIDASAALALPGVHKVITAADVPGDRYVGLIVRDWPVLVAIGEETRCVGDIVAIVVADDQRTARKAAKAIDVSYDVHEPITTPEDALKPDAPKIHPGGNLLSTSKIKRGDIDAAFSNSAHIVEGEYETQRIEHMFLEPEACIAVPQPSDNGAGKRLRIYSQGQGVFDDQRQIASVLGWAPERVYVELVSNGGAFGGKEDMSIQAQTALAAALCDRP
ncbi:MAG: molybdopterin-dependent oxidoreductase, partial [Phycisphaerales bacterium]|nr:molybdopterin-dependent oxidoreductase [Phycisphaerales bacterium]